MSEKRGSSDKKKVERVRERQSERERQEVVEKGREMSAFEEERMKAGSGRGGREKREGGVSERATKEVIESYRKLVSLDVSCITGTLLTPCNRVTTER